jgi:ABC-type proline/glycine betaine transport system, ATPase component
MVFQNFALLPHRNIINNVEYGLELQGVDHSERREKAKKRFRISRIKRL